MSKRKRRSKARSVRSIRHDFARGLASASRFGSRAEWMSEVDAAAERAIGSLITDAQLKAMPWTARALATRSAARAAIASGAKTIPRYLKFAELMDALASEATDDLIARLETRVNTILRKLVRRDQARRLRGPRTNMARLPEMPAPTATAVDASGSLLGDLTEDEEWALRLRMRGLTLEQIAEQMNCSVSHVKRLLSSAMAKISRHGKNAASVSPRQAS